MCKRELYQTPVLAHGDGSAYEGKTVRLDPGTARRACRFPFWTLWMIWPLMGILKWSAPLTFGIATAVFDGFRLTSAAPIAAIALIIAGLVLIIRG